MKKTGLGIVVLFALAVLYGAFSGKQVKAAETYIGHSETMEGADNYTLNLNTEYYITLSGHNGYVSFVTPAQEGYIRVEYKNITLNGWQDCYIKSVIGDTLASDDASSGGTREFEFKSESNNNNGAVMAANTRYYLQVGDDNADISGNAKLTVYFTPDVNPNGKAQAEMIALNTPYTRSLDARNLTDTDYFAFTAQSTGVHRLSLTNVSSDDWINYEIRKWSTDELVANLNGRDVKDEVPKGNTGTQDMYLEAGQTYYLIIDEDKMGSYTFLIDTHRVSGISVTSSKQIEVNQEFTLNPVISPSNAFNKEVEYATSNYDVASVSSNGVVSGRMPGMAVITVKAKDGSNVSAKCTVYVSPYAPAYPSFAKATSSTIKLNWSSSNSASGYYIYRKSGKTWKKIGSTNNTTFTVKKLKAATGYQFRIKSYKVMDKKKFVSGYSKTVSAATAPGKSKVVKVKKLSKIKGWFSDNYRAKVSWKKVKGASHYKLYYSLPGYSSKYLYGTYTKTSAVFSRSYSHGFTGSKKVNFYVVAVKKYKNNESLSAYSKKKVYRMH